MHNLEVSEENTLLAHGLIILMVFSALALWSLWSTFCANVAGNSLYFTIKWFCMLPPPNFQNNCASWGSDDL